MATRILIVSDQRGVRENLRQLLETQLDLRVVGTAEDTAGALEQARKLAPHLVLLDLHLGSAKTLPLLSELLRLALAPRVLVMTSQPNALDEREALRLGAAGTVNKLGDRNSLIANIRQALRDDVAPDEFSAPFAGDDFPLAAPLIAADTDEPPTSRSFALSLGGGVHDMEVQTGESHNWRFREALARWASGVCVVTVRLGESIQGITASAFCSLSLEPPLALVAIGEGQRIVQSLLASRFTINLLTADQQELADFFAGRGVETTQPAFLEDEVLAGSMAALVCSLWQAHPGGDHRIVIGKVERVWLGEQDAPLLYFRRDYRRLAE